MLHHFFIFVLYGGKQSNPHINCLLSSNIGGNSTIITPSKQ